MENLRLAVRLYGGSARLPVLSRKTNSRYTAVPVPDEEAGAQLENA